MLLYARARILAPSPVETLIDLMRLYARADPGAAPPGDPHSPDTALPRPDAALHAHGDPGAEPCAGPQRPDAVLRARGDPGAELR
eukprot:4316099-Alexandrium_andersonii.AAC.1